MLKIQFLTSRKTDYQQRAKWGYPSTTDQMQGQCGGGGLVTKSCLTLVTTWTIVLQAPLSMGFSRQEYRSGLPFTSKLLKKKKKQTLGRLQASLNPLTWKYP